MQQQCSRSSCSSRSYFTDVQAASVVPCSCGLLHGMDDAGPGAFSVFFAAAAIDEQQLPEEDDSSCASPSSAVDCTLSLGTPSTRHQSSRASKPLPVPAVIQRQQRNTFPLRFDFLRTDQLKQTSPSATSNGAEAALRTGGAGLKVGGDPVQLLSRRCASCDTTSTPLWRNGPRGPKSLCNACGIRYKKEERRAASSAAAQSSTSSSSSASSPAALPSPQHQQQQHLTTSYGGYHHPWGCPAPTLAASRKCPSSTILSAISLDSNIDAMEATALPYVPWQRFNVAVPPQAAEFAKSRFQDYGLH